MPRVVTIPAIPIGIAIVRPNKCVSVSRGLITILSRYFADYRFDIRYISNWRICCICSSISGQFNHVPRLTQNLGHIQQAIQIHQTSEVHRSEVCTGVDWIILITCMEIELPAERGPAITGPYSAGSGTRHLLPNFPLEPSAFEDDYLLSGTPKVYNSVKIHTFIILMVSVYYVMGKLPGVITWHHRRRWGS